MTTYRQALQRETDKRYDFTSSTGSSAAYAIGYCAGWKEMADYGTAAWDKTLKDGLERAIEEKRPHQAKYHIDGYATAAEAHACYRQYELDNELEFKTLPMKEAETLHKCQAPECEEFTAGTAFLGQYTHFHLCDTHRNREAVEAILNKKSAP